MSKRKDKIVQRVEKNTSGRDFIIGDIHGFFSKVQEELDSIGFSPDAGDRLFSVGDLVDRGPESEASIEWINKPWFFAVAGNHEDMAIRWPDDEMDAGNYIANGGKWNVTKSADESIVFAEKFRDLPVAIQLETENGLVGIVHADCPLESWHDFVSALETGWVRLADGELSNSTLAQNSLIGCAQWSRRRIELGRIGFSGTDVSGVRAVVVGHTPLDSVVVVGNVHHIDTGGWHPQGNGFTIIDAATLQKVN